MIGERNIALELDRVSRLYPRNISDTPFAILREMLLPRRLLATAGRDTFFALRQASLCLHKGQKLGVIGAHQSGKSTLAAIASGLLRPTGGTVSAQGRRLLLSRPTAGFKPTLTSFENLRLRASLAGMHGQELQTLLDKTLSHCGLNQAAARQPMGNLSPYLVKQLGLTLLLDLPAEILIVDEISSAGLGHTRWQTRALLQDKINSSTSLVISSDYRFLQEVVEDAVLIHQGVVYGPFGLDEAMAYFNSLTDGDVLLDLLENTHDLTSPPSTTEPDINIDSLSQSSDENLIPRDQPRSKFNTDSTMPQRTESDFLPERSPWKVISTTIDGKPYKHSLSSIIRRPGETISVKLEMISLRKQTFHGGRFSLFAGGGGFEVGFFNYEAEGGVVFKNQKLSIEFDIESPDWQEEYYRLAFSPLDEEKHPINHRRIKLLIFGTGFKPESKKARKLHIFVRSACVDVLPEKPLG